MFYVMLNQKKESKQRQTLAERIHNLNNEEQKEEALEDSGVQRQQ